MVAKKRKKIIAIVTSAFIFFIVIFGVLKTVIIPRVNYDFAVDCYNMGHYHDAYKAFSSMNYKDSSERAEECLFLIQKSSFSDVTVGSTIVFGYYEQDNDTSNGKEDIEWLILEKEGNKVLVISKYVLDCQPYNLEYEKVTWETCFLREWLNDTFYNEAFGNYQKNLIANTKVSEDKKPWYSFTSSGNETTDRIFLLSLNEAKEYFSSFDYFQCKGTEYCIAQGRGDSIQGNYYWWLRTPSNISQLGAKAATFSDSLLYSIGFEVDTYLGVRPAMWINLE